MQARQSLTTWWLDLSFLTITLGCLFFILLGERPLFVPDEGRYAEIAREMAVSGDFITPYLNNIKYFEKPALFYWLGALAMKIGGVNLWSVRLINALLGLFACLATYYTARKIYGRSTALIASFILGTSALYFVMAHMVSLDLPVTVFLSMTLFSFILGIQQAPGKTRRHYFWCASAFAGLAVLTKGLIGLVLPILIIGVWLTFLGQWHQLKKSNLLSCILIFLLITVPWHVLVGLKNPEFFYFYFVEQHFLRYLTPDVGHVQPAWYFMTALIAGFFPWTVFLLQGLAYSLPLRWQERHNDKSAMFFLIWVFIIFTFFSFSKSKLIPYILPIFPPLAILTARFLQATLHKPSKWLGYGYIGFALMSGLLAYVLYQFSHGSILPDPQNARNWLGIASSMIVIGSLSCLIYSFNKPRTALIIAIISSYLFLLAILIAAPAIDTRSILPLANKLKPLLTPQDEVITYNQYYQDLPFYLERRVSILNWQNELGPGMQHQDTSEWMINNQTFWQRWHSQQRVFVILSQEEFAAMKKQHPNIHPHVISETINNILISNRS